MALQPSQNADDIGARFGDPSSFSVEIRTTGVPKYKMPGSMRACVGIVVVTALTLPHAQPTRWRQSDATYRPGPARRPRCKPRGHVTTGCHIPTSESFGNSRTRRSVTRLAVGIMGVLERPGKRRLLQHQREGAAEAAWSARVTALTSWSM